MHEGVRGESEAVSNCTCVFMIHVQCINMLPHHHTPPPPPLPSPTHHTSILRTRTTLVRSFLRRSTMLPFLKTFCLAALSHRLVPSTNQHSGCVQSSLFEFPLFAESEHVCLLFIVLECYIYTQHCTDSRSDSDL